MQDSGKPNEVERRDDPLDLKDQDHQSDPTPSPHSDPVEPELLRANSTALREMLTIAIPSVATMTSYTIMGFVDKFMVKDIGDDPVYVAAQSNGAMMVWLMMAYILGMNGVINSFVSQNYGAGKPERGAAYVWNGLWIGLFFYALFMLPMYFIVPHIFGSLHADQPSMIGFETQYAQIMILGGIFVVSTRSIHHYFYGLHRPNVVLISAVFGNLINVILNMVFIFGDQGIPIRDNWFGLHIVAPVAQPIMWIASTLGIEPMGIKGAAIATVIGGAGEFIIPFVLFLSPRYARLFGTRSAWRMSRKCIKDLFRIGVAPGMMFINEMICWAFLMMKLIPMGGKAVGDDPVLHNTVGWIALQYMHLTFMPAMGLSIATQAMVGKAMGMGRPDIAASRARLALIVTVGYMCVCAPMFIIFRHQLIDVFINPDIPPEMRARMIEIGATIMIAAAVFQIFDAIAITTSAALRGAGDTVWPGVATIVLSWLCIPGFGLLLIHVAPELGSTGPWIGAALYIICLGLALRFRFVGGKWKTMTLVEQEQKRTEPIDLDPFDDVLTDPTIGSV